MSSIGKLSIRGIRSFGQEDSDRQIIEFFHPLTLITGLNGAGKTTVIECLKYVTTGDMPPGSKGVAFIHDPKVAHETEVKAQVKLKFTDVTGRQAVVTRNLVASQKLKKIEFKSLEGVIARNNDLGERVSLSSKCAEIDREMVASLGVSKPVLNSVIFCHQEEANWPLSEGKVLKGKFDEIFAATRYIKALDVIRKLRTEQGTQIREYNTEVKYLKEYKDKAKELAIEFESKQAMLAAANDSVSHVTKELQPIVKRIQEIENREDEIASLSTEVAQCKAEKAERQRTKSELEDSLEFIFQGTNDELSTIYKEHETRIEEKYSSLKQTEKKLNSLEKILQQTSDQKSSQLLNQGKLEQYNEQHLERIDNRALKMKAISQTMNFADFTQESYSEAKVIEFLQLMDNALKEMEEEYARLLNQYKKQENTLNSNLQEFQNIKIKLEHTVQMKSDLMLKNTADLKGINHQLNQVESNAYRLKELEEELKRAEVERHDAEGAVDLHKLRSEVKTLQNEKQRQDAMMSRLSDEMTTISLQSKTRTQFEMLDKEKKAKEDQLTKIRGRHEENVNHLLGHFPTENIRKKLADYIFSKETELKNSNSSLQKIRSQLTTKQANKKMIIDQLQVKEEELRCYENQLTQHCGRQDVDVTLQELQQSINTLQSEKGAFTGSSHLFERYIRSLQKTQAHCPLCHRGFDGQSEVDELVQELQDKLRVAPSKIAEKEDGIRKNRAKYEQMIELKPVKKNVISLKDEIPNLKSKLSSINTDIDKLQTSLTNEEDMLSLLEVDVSIANEMKPDIWQMNRSLGELKELEHKLAIQSQKLSGADANRTMQQVNAERQEAEIKLDTIIRTLDYKQQQINQHSENLQQLATNVNSITSEKLRLSGELQQQDKLQTQKAELISTNQSYSREIEDARNQLKPVETKLNKLSKEKDILREKKENMEEKHRTDYSQTKDKRLAINTYTDNINRYVSSGMKQQLEAGRQGIADLNETLGKLNKDKKDLSNKMNHLKKELANQQVRERELADNIQLRKKTDEIAKVDQELRKLMDKLGGIVQESMKTEKKKLKQKEANLNKEKNQADGRKAILKEEVKKVEKELKSDMYRNAEVGYSEMVIKLKTTEVANHDLDKYSKALERAVMNYHHMKMAEINKIIRDLWRITYRGQDIDFVEIRSDEEVGGSQQRKNYNYRVVMVKGTTSLDMRGRCSAGQKVLASLIIRLALAETFCLSCGILALDEPTTNLDKDNIESLAQALVDIIKNREQQRNFQLIVITHDEDFVQLIGHSQYADYFYRITKNEEFKSTVNKRDIGSLQAMDNYK